MPNTFKPFNIVLVLVFNSRKIEFFVFVFFTRLFRTAVSHSSIFHVKRYFHGSGLSNKVHDINCKKKFSLDLEVS